MKQYLDILANIEANGQIKKNRTGIDTKSITGAFFEHDMGDGFPLLTTKKMGLKTIATELEFFIKGMSDKQWLKDRGCHIWDDWCNPEKVPYGNDDVTKQKMKDENDLGRIYGVQWRDWKTTVGIDVIDPDISLYKQDLVVTKHIDQLKNVIEKLKTNPFDRRMIVMAWNPAEIDQMALPPCHYSFQLLSDGEHVDLIWNQRSCDIFLGSGFNIASYGLLLEIIAKTVGMKARKLVGQWADVHIYQNHMEQVKEQLTRTPKKLPEIEITCNDIFSWTREDFILKNYESHPRIKAEVAV